MPTYTQAYAKVLPEQTMMVRCTNIVRTGMHNAIQQIKIGFSLIQLRRIIELSVDFKDVEPHVMF